MPGKPGKRHPDLLRKFARACGVSDDRILRAEENGEILPTTRAMRAWIWELSGIRPLGEACAGIMVALEGQLPTLYPKYVEAMHRMGFSDDDLEDVWEWEDYARAMVIGPLTGARYLGMAIEALAPIFGGFERRQAAVPMAEGIRLMRQAITGDFEFKSLTNTLSGVGLLIGGRASWASISASIMKQVDGLADTVTRTDAEREAEQAKRDKATLKEAAAAAPAKPEKPQEQKDAEAAKRRAKEAARAAAIRAAAEE
jgi:hypothetical protein